MLLRGSLALAQDRLADRSGSWSRGPWLEFGPPQRRRLGPELGAATHAPASGLEGLGLGALFP